MAQKQDNRSETINMKVWIMLVLAVISLIGYFLIIEVYKFFNRLNHKSHDLYTEILPSTCDVLRNIQLQYQPWDTFYCYGILPSSLDLHHAVGRLTNTVNKLLRRRDLTSKQIHVFKRKQGNFPIKITMSQRCKAWAVMSLDGPITLKHGNKIKVIAHAALVTSAKPVNVSINGNMFAFVLMDTMFAFRK